MKIYRKISIAILFLCLAAPVSVFPNADDAPTSYVCQFVPCPINVDGYPNEKAWSLADSLEFYRPPGKNPVKSPAEGRLIWNNERLFVFIRASDKDLIATMTEKDSQTFKEDVLEIFLSPSIKSGFSSYCNFEISPKGVVFDAMNVKDWKMKKRVNWDCQGLRLKTVVSGSLNDSEDQDDFWALEAGIPWEAFEPMGAGKPEPGDAWRFHLARYDYSRYLEGGKELQSTAVLSKVNFHYHRDWSPLVFEKNMSLQSLFGNNR